MTERTYTLEEAARELKRRECTAHGHDFSVLQQGDRPVAVHCECCGRRWAVVEEES
jgi:hypothetical protein